MTDPHPGAHTAHTTETGDPATGPTAAPPARRPTREDVRARLSVCLVFALMGSVIGGWSARIPEVRDAVGLDDAGWGLASTASTAGDLVALALITALIGRVNIRLLTLAGAALVLVNAPFLAAAATLPALIAGLVAWGFSAMVLSTPMNAQAVEVERRYGRPLMSGFHACFSWGVLGGSLAGTAAAAAGVSPALQLTANSVVLGTMLLAAAKWLPDEAARATRATRTARSGGTLRTLRRRFTPRLRLLAAIAFACAFVEGAAWQWSAIYAADSLGAGATMAAATYTALTAATALARLLGDRALAALGHQRFLRLSALTAAAGMALVTAWPHPAAAMTGFAVTGLGVACMSPTVFGLAGRQPDLTPGEGVSVAVMGQWPGFLIAPPLIGLLAGATSLRLALLSLVVVAAASALLSSKVRA